MDKLPDLDKALAALVAIQNDHVMVHLCLDPLQAWGVLAVIQLAVKHPILREGPTRKIVLNIARNIQEKVAPEGPLAELAEAGWGGTLKGDKT